MTTQTSKHFDELRAKVEEQLRDKVKSCANCLADGLQAFADSDCADCFRHPMLKDRWVDEGADE